MTVRLAASVLATLLAAAGLALLSWAVLAVDADLRGVDEQLSADQAGGVSRSGPVSRLADRLLGIADDRSLRQALDLVAASRRPGTPVRGVLERHGEAVVRLDALARSEADPALRSYAANLAGLLALEDAALDPGSRARFLELGLDGFRVAVLADPANEDAKYNLELVLAALITPAETDEDGEEQPAPEGRSAGTSPPGEGY